MISERRIPTILLRLTPRIVLAIKNPGYLFLLFVRRRPQELFPSMFAKNEIESFVLPVDFDDDHIRRLKVGEGSPSETTQNIFPFGIWVGHTLLERGRTYGRLMIEREENILIDTAREPANKIRTILL